MTTGASWKNWSTAGTHRLKPSMPRRARRVAPWRVTTSSGYFARASVPTCCWSTAMRRATYDAWRRCAACTLTADRWCERCSGRAVFDFPGVVEDVPCHPAHEVARAPASSAARTGGWYLAARGGLECLHDRLARTRHSRLEVLVGLAAELDADATQVALVGAQHVLDDTVQVAPVAARAPRQFLAACC